MADEFRRRLDEDTGPGGVHCECCNKYFGKERKRLRRLARRQLKQEVRDEVAESQVRDR